MSVRVGAALSLLASVLAVEVAVSGCQQTPAVSILNMSGKIIELKMGDYRRKYKKTFENGQWRRVKNVKWRSNPRISTGNCTYFYDLKNFPSTISGFSETGEEFVNAPVAVQIEPDFSLYLRWGNLIEPKTGAELDVIQPPGFPLRPVSEICA